MKIDFLKKGKIFAVAIVFMALMVSSAFVGTGAVISKNENIGKTSNISDVNEKNILSSNLQFLQIDEENVGIENEMELGIPLENPTGFIEWDKTFDSDYSDSGYCVQQTSDGGYIAVGHGFAWDIWLIKIDSNGNKEWYKTFDRTRLDYGRYVQQTTDGGYIVLGESSTSGEPIYAWLIKTDNHGNKQWDRLLSKKKFSWGRSAQQTADGGYIIAGYTTHNLLCPDDTWLIKTDANGYEEWSKTFGYMDHDRAYSIQQTTDGGYIVVGVKRDSQDPYVADIWLIKTDSQGNVAWDKTFGDPSVWNEGHFVRQTFDGGYIIVGGYLLIKTDTDGNEIWRKSIGGQCVQQTKDDGYIITGYKEYWWKPWWGNTDLKLIKTNSQGNKEWCRTYGGIYNDVGRFVQQTSDEGYIIIGFREFPLNHPAAERDIWLIKTGKKPKLNMEGTRSVTLSVNQQNIQINPQSNPSSTQQISLSSQQSLTNFITKKTTNIS